MESSLRFNIHDYSEPAIAGTTLSFNCSQPEEVLIGPNTTTCMYNGRWVPDPLQPQISCKGTGRNININIVCAITGTHTIHW